MCDILVWFTLISNYLSLKSWHVFSYPLYLFLKCAIHPQRKRDDLNDSKLTNNLWLNKIFKLTYWLVPFTIWKQQSNVFHNQFYLLL